MAVIVCGEPSVLLTKNIQIVFYTLTLILYRHVTSYLLGYTYTTQLPIIRFYTINF